MRRLILRSITKVVIMALAAVAVLLLPDMIKNVYADDETVNVYRLYTPVNGEHLYTTDANEVRVLTTRYGWTSEGIGWYAPATGTPVYRLYNAGLRNHLYTTDTNEVRVLTTRHGWQLDNDGKPLFYSGGTVGIYRLYNEGLQGMHLLTTDTNEYKVIPAYGWDQEGTKLYGVNKKEQKETAVQNSNQSQPSTYTGFRPDLDMQAKQLILEERAVSDNIDAVKNPEWNEHLYKVAQARAQEIVTNFSHDSAWAISGYNVSEALTGTWNTELGAESAIYNWKNSPAHYDIMVAGDQFAVACYQQGDTLYWCCLIASKDSYIAENYAKKYADIYIEEWKSAATRTWQEAYDKEWNTFERLYGKRNIW